MSKFFKTIAALILIISGLGLYGMHVLEDQLVSRLPDLLKQVRPPVQTGLIHKGTCRLDACIVVPDMRVSPNSKTTLDLGTVTLDIPPLYPVRVHLKNESTPHFVLDATIGQHVWDIRTISGTVEQLTFHLTGQIDISTESGALTLQTTGLKTFLQNHLDLPPALTWLFTDSDSTLTLTPQKGFLCFQGIPLIPLRTFQ